MLLPFLFATAHAETPADAHAPVALHRAGDEDDDRDGKKGKGKKGKGGKKGGKAGDGKAGDGKNGGKGSKGGKNGGGKGGRNGGGKGGKNGGGDGTLRGEPRRGGGDGPKRDDGGPLRDGPREGGPRRDPPCAREDGNLRGGGGCPDAPRSGPRQPPAGGPRQPEEAPRGTPARSQAPSYDWAGRVGLGAAPGFSLSGRDGDPTIDPGLRLIGRFRPSNVVGIELNAAHHDSFGAFGNPRRSDTAFDGLLVLNALPRTGAILALEGGAQYLISRYGETVDAELVKDPKWGADLGLVFGAALSQHFTLEFSNRMVAWLFDERTPGEPLAAYQGGMNLVGWF